MTNNCYHWAYCPETGEVLGSSTVNGLRRHVAHNVRYDRKCGYPRKSWCFHHGSYESLRLKALA